MFLELPIAATVLLVVLHIFEVGCTGRKMPLLLRLTACLAWHYGFVCTLTATIHIISPGCIVILVVFRSVARHTDVIIFHIIAALMTVILIPNLLTGFLPWLRLLPLPFQFLLPLD